MSKKQQRKALCESCEHRGLNCPLREKFSRPCQPNRAFLTLCIHYKRGRSKARKSKKKKEHTVKAKLQKKYALMGRTVTVHSVLERTNTATLRTWVPTKLQTSRAGWVVGFRTLQNRRYQPPSYHPLNEVENAGRLANVQPVKCVLVVFWPTMNSVKVPMDGFSIGGHPQPPSHHPLEDRKLLSRQAKEAPRDERGRFLPAWCDSTQQLKMTLGGVL